jgi:DNA-binding CsgD family transcriptional regulator
MWVNGPGGNPENRVRVLLIGAADDRARFRASLNGSLRVVGEFETLASAEASGLDADGILVIPTSRLKPALEQGELPEPLTPREIQVLELLAEGLPNKAIAARLQISDQTVKFHVASIYGKLGAANRTDAVRRAVRRGFITL